MRKFEMLVLLLFSFSAIAEDDSKQLKKEWNETCRNATSYKHGNYCLLKLEERAIVLLDKKYQTLLEYLKKPDKDRLVDAQNKWIKYVTADCLFYSPTSKEGDYSYTYNVGCRLTHKLQRLEKLENYNFGKGCNGCSW